MVSIAIAGLGTVGSGVIRLLHENAELISARIGQSIEIAGVSARHQKQKRSCDISSFPWFTDPNELIDLPRVDIVVELIGGADGPALKFAEAALRAGKHLVTANKALLAKHGGALARLAETHQASLAFEAAVAGGIPVIKTLREGLAANKMTVVRGILNGTCNYILTRMRDGKLGFADALKEAQEKGYAESDPTSDIDGLDTANKLAILSALAFGTDPDLASVRVEGIRRITSLDLQFADELDCRVKLLGVARQGEKGIDQRVGPSLVACSSPLAEVDGVRNAVLLRGNYVGDITLEGQGAGADATASAVVADIVDIVRGRFPRVFGVKASQLIASDVHQAQPVSRYYVRLQVVDKPGVVADISTILRDEAISIESLIQRGKSMTESVPVVITTHEADPASMRRAVEKIAGLSTSVERPCVMPIED